MRLFILDLPLSLFTSFLGSAVICLLLTLLTEGLCLLPRGVMAPSLLLIAGDIVVLSFLMEYGEGEGVEFLIGVMVVVWVSVELGTDVRVALLATCVCEVLVTLPAFREGLLLRFRRRYSEDLRRRVGRLFL